MNNFFGKTLLTLKIFALACGIALAIGQGYEAWGAETDVPPCPEEYTDGLQP